MNLAVGFDEAVTYIRHNYAACLAWWHDNDSTQTQAELAPSLMIKTKAIEFDAVTLVDDVMWLGRNFHHNTSF